jgi:hypothetical protein
VYGPQGDDEKILFLQELRDVRTACAGPWLVAGDFNLIYKTSDKNNSNYNRAMMGRFRGLVNDLALKEIPLLGRKYTWSNQQDNPVLVKLDRVFCSVDWELTFPRVILHGAASLDSDHCPLLLGLSDSNPGKRRFHFKSFWTKLEGFQEEVHSTWVSVDAIRCPFQTLEKKLKMTAKRLQGWSDKQVGHVRLQLALAKDLLHRLEMAHDERPFTPAELWFKNRLKKQSLLLSSFKRTMARLRSRISWPKLITKMLANRLAKRLNELVSLIQSAFIKGRFIQDNFMLVQQTARLLHQQKLPRLLLKLDITKAFDSVS